MSAVRVGRVGGIPVYVERSWGLVLALAGAAMLARTAWDGTQIAAAAAIAVVGALVFAGSVLAHEAGHALAARWLGVPVLRVTLFLFGGYTEMAQDPGSPRTDLVVALAGPAASTAVAGLLWLAGRPLAGPLPGGADVLGLLAAINLAVAVFNLLPGMPLDGGRILRAVWWRLGGDRRRADLVAAGAGRVLGALLVAGGLATAVAARAPAALGVVAVGWFVHAAAVTEAGTGAALAEPVAVVMSAAGRSVPPHEVVAGPLSGPLPVVAGGRVIGLVVVSPEEPILARDAMIPLQRADVLDEQDPLGEAVARIERTGRPVAVVRSGRFAGVVMPERLAEWLAGRPGPPETG